MVHNLTAIQGVNFTSSNVAKEEWLVDMFNATRQL